MKAAEFLESLAVRLENLYRSGVNATHPAAMSYALGLRVSAGSKNAQGSGVPFEATTSSVGGRLVNDPSNANHATDKAWKAGASAADAYGALLDDEYGPGTAQLQRDFEAYGSAWLNAPGDAPPWYFAALGLLPSLTQGDARANVARFVLGGADPAFVKGATPTMPILTPEHRRNSVLSLMPGAPSLDRLAGVARMSPPTSSTPAAPSSSSSAPVIGGAVGAVAGGAAGYYLAGRNPLIAGAAGLVGAIVGYFGGNAVAK